MMLKRLVVAFSGAIGFLASFIAVTDYGQAYVLTWVDREFEFTELYQTRMRDKANSYVFVRQGLRGVLHESESGDIEFNHDVKLANDAMIGLSWCIWLRVCGKSDMPHYCRHLVMTYRDAYSLWQFRSSIFKVKPSRHWEYVARRCDWNGYEYPFLKHLDLT